MKNILIIYLVTILALVNAGCLDDNSVIKADDDLRGKDVDFHIVMLSEDISNTTNKINISISLKNNEEKPIRLYEYGLYYSGIKITDPKGVSYSIDRGNISWPSDKIILETGEKHITTFELKSENYYNKSYGELGWNRTGLYKCQAFAYHINSNQIEFQIKAEKSSLP